MIVRRLYIKIKILKLILLIFTLGIIGNIKISSDYISYAEKYELLNSKSNLSETIQVSKREKQSNVLEDTKIDVGKVYQESKYTSLDAINSTVNLSDYTIIGDSNTVRMYNEGCLEDFGMVAGIVNVGVHNWENYIDISNTTNNKSIKQYVVEKVTSKYIIMLGTNDYKLSKEDFIGRYTELIEFLMFNGAEEINLCTIPPVFDEASYSIKNKDTIRINEYIREIVDNSENNKLNIIDMENELSISIMSKDFGDGYHLSSVGCTVQSECIKNEISKNTVYLK